MNIPHRALGIVREIAADVGHEVTYAYEDLVFMDHNGYLFQFGAEPHMLDLYFNIEFPADESDEMTAKLVEAASKRSMTIERKGHYELAQKPDDNLEVKFFNPEKA
ncbi:MAG: hypothetical protein OQK66_04760 [Prosthecochloris sp.]|uniref:Uncharacterized protein n=1 Tax=Prosthecochloris aestuarii (strain DSM 271 / SK 413) TaxID=290512 RepID=B4S707_PROA2|nr:MULTISPECIES: hypothetical protein [Prosthecochloris]ACF45844.1 conserved hypothetical protein [Prosthecochloris aestuarii DSM 271]MCW8798258.1 hypothetical protein [Prosthecochloris sp.]NEX11433.1 hypothetical protein [Prosthecochloris sp.]RDD30644.1 hypothetical protein CR161_07960 [Prosthecochloris sp. ZM]